MSPEPVTVASLGAALAARGVAAEVERLTRLSGGASRETWSVDLRGGDQLVLQRERPGGIHTGTGMAGEAALLRAASLAGVPVPTVVATDEGLDDLGAPFVVTEKVQGESLARRILGDDAFGPVRGSLAPTVGAAAAAVHSIDAAGLDGALSQSDQLADLEGLLDLLGEPHPAFELGLRRLAATRPAPGPAVVVHGDLRMGNLLVDPDRGLTAVLDWELAHLGDGAEDLGWCCVRAWRFGSPHRALGTGDAADLLDGYRRAGGREVSEGELDWWEAVGTLKWGVICVMQAATHLGGGSRSVELATIGRRTCENEWDLLDLLAPEATTAARAATRPSPDAAGGVPAASGWRTPGARPTTGELVEAVREFLDRDVKPATEGRVSFHSRVAINALAMVERELALGPELVERHATRLAGLGCETEAELAAAIRGGSYDERFEEVAAVLADDAADQLVVNHPGYTAPD